MILDQLEVGGGRGCQSTHSDRLLYLNAHPYEKWTNVIKGGRVAIHKQRIRIRWLRSD